jgi:glycosyltransferase involved in cell wall biosynthesis
MADQPLVSVVTPTWQRYEFLLGRCMPSAAAQTYGNVEHIIVSDGPDPELAERIARVTAWRGDSLRFEQLPEHDPAIRWGLHARLRGIALAKGEYIAYLDDDNAFRPEHISRLVAALEASPAAGFAYSRMQVNGRGPAYVIGTDPPACGLIDTSEIMHRPALLEVATWQDDGQQETIDWDLVSRWMAAGITWVLDDAVTADYYAND